MTDTPPRRRPADRLVEPDPAQPPAQPVRKPLIRVEIDREGLAAFDRRAILAQLGVGVVAGWLASWLVGGGGLFQYAVSGVVGSFVGPFLLDKLGVTLGLKSAVADRIATATIGAAVVVILARLVA